MSTINQQKSIYLAGPMRGIKDFNFPAFHVACKQLRDAGHKVFNPAEHDEQKHGVDFNKSEHGDFADLKHTNFDIKPTLRDDIKWIADNATTIALLPGWSRSSGARAEHAFALAIGLEVLLLTGAEVGPNLVPPAPPSTTNPKDLLGITKPNLYLVPPAFLLHVAKAMENGAKKYGAYNWRAKKVKMTIYLSAALRHILALIDGENTADDSGLRHEAHAAACFGILLDAMETGNLIDDRPTKGCAGRLIEEMTVKQKPLTPLEQGICPICDAQPGTLHSSTCARAGFNIPRNADGTCKGCYASEGSLHQDACPFHQKIPAMNFGCPDCGGQSHHTPWCVRRTG